MKQNKKLIGSVALLIIISIFFTVGYFINKAPQNYSDKDIFVEADKGEKNGEKYITVYINGEVKNPGVYNLKPDSRVNDLIKASGGLNDKADKSRLNLAKKLKDEDYILVDSIVEENTVNESLSNVNNTKSNGKVNINKASKEELKTIPGIGDVTAQKIIDYRESNNGFSRVEDIKKIDRIGDKTFEKIKDKIDVN
ncbi:MAG: DNA-binding protein [Clostridiaceae bacterium]|nr:DNA-binding protein [Clostridiaceae bacterium]